MRNRGFEVYIECEGAPLEEYLVNVEDDEKTITCWVPSEAGKKFSICFRDVSSAEWGSKVQLFADGIQTSGGKCCPPGADTKWPYTRISTGIKAPYMFSEVMLSDNDELLKEKTSNAFGTIEAKIYRITGIITYERSGAHTESLREAMQEKRLLHEKSKTLSTHCIAVGEVIPYKFAGLVVAPAGYVDPPEDYYVHFVFRYRPREILQAQDIIPLTSAQQDKQSLKRDRTGLGTNSVTGADKRRRTALPARGEPSTSTQISDSSTSTLSNEPSSSTQSSEELIRSLQMQLKDMKERMGRLESVANAPVKLKVEKVEPSEAVALGRVKREPEVIDLSED